MSQQLLDGISLLDSFAEREARDPDALPGQSRRLQRAGLLLAPLPAASGQAVTWSRWWRRDRCAGLGVDGPARGDTVGSRRNLRIGRRSRPWTRRACRTRLTRLRRRIGRSVVCGVRSERCRRILSDTKTVAERDEDGTASHWRRSWRHRAVSRTTSFRPLRCSEQLPGCEVVSSC
jgi:hypothetical protein